MTTELAKIKQDADALIEQLNAFVIRTREDFDNVSRLRQTAKKTIEVWEGYHEPEREKRYADLEETYEEINLVKKPMTKAIKAAGDKMSDYQIAEEHRVAEVKKRLEEESVKRMEAAVINQAVKTGDVSFLDTEIVAPDIKLSVHKPEGTSFVTDWDIEIIDLALVPIEFMIPDEKRILKTVKASKGQRSIPGVRIIEKRQIRQTVA
jgi:hypothetical protein